MSKAIEHQNEEIITLLGKYPEGIARGKISEKLNFSINDKTLQRRLAALIKAGRIAKAGNRKATRYYTLDIPIETIKGQSGQYIQF